VKLAIKEYPGRWPHQKLLRRLEKLASKLESEFKSVGKLGSDRHTVHYNNVVNALKDLTKHGVSLRKIMDEKSMEERSIEKQLDESIPGGVKSVQSILRILDTLSKGDKRIMGVIPYGSRRAYTKVLLGKSLGEAPIEAESLGQGEVNRILDSVKTRRKPIFALWSYEDYKNLTEAQLDEIKKLALWYPKTLKVRIYGVDPDMVGTVDNIVFTSDLPNKLAAEIGKNTTINLSTPVTDPTRQHAS